MSFFFPNPACLWGSYNKEKISVRVGREGGSPIMQGPVPPKILVPRSWYQDLGTKKKRIAREAEPLAMQGGTGGCKPPARGSLGLEAPRNSRGSGGRQPPSKNNFVDPEPPSDHLQPPSTDHLFITIFREKVKPITTPPDKVFERPG